MRLVRVALGALLLLLSVPSLGEAQFLPNTRQGLWAGLGLGRGAGRIGCAICRGDRETDLSGYVRFGATVSPQFLLGGEVDHWRRSSEDLSERITSYQAVAYWYPGLRGAFYVKGGLGVVTYRAEDEADLLRADALGGQVGVGYELRVARSFSFTPYVNLIGSSKGDLKLNAAPITDDANVSLFQFGVGLTWHMGVGSR